jgi:hypothetical protein
MPKRSSFAHFEKLQESLTAEVMVLGAGRTPELLNSCNS